MVHPVDRFDSEGWFSPDQVIFLPAALRAAQACRYLIYSEADFEVFRPAGATRCTDGLKFGMPNFTPIRCNDKSVGPQN